MKAMSVLYPIAPNADAALHGPIGYAARERAAEALAGEAVVFVTEMVGPMFETEGAALDAYAGRLDDARPGRTGQVAPEARWCALKPVAPPGAARLKAPITPVNQDGRRWPAPAPKTPKALWRLSVSYWRVGGAETGAEPGEAARKVRRKPGGEELDPKVLRALARQPLQPVRAQQPLDIGLFEMRLPEAPHIVMPDE